MTCPRCGVEVPDTRTICACGRVLPALATISLPASVTPTRTARTPRRDPATVNHNSWERGVASSDRGNGERMPYLDSGGQPIGVKDWAGGKRAQFESAGLA